MARTYALYNLPASRRTYDVRRLAVTPDSENCPVCYRTFGTKDNPSDPTEVACDAAEIYPCKHIIRTGCLKALAEAGMDTCQQCRTQLTVIADMVPRSIQYLISTQWYIVQCDAMRAFAAKDHEADYFDRLSKRLFNGTCDANDPFNLWSCHARASGHYSWHLATVLFLTYIVVKPIGWFFGRNFIELRALELVGFRPSVDEPLLAFAIFAAVAIFTYKAILDHIRMFGSSSPLLCIGLFWWVARALEALVGLTGVFSLLFLNWVAFVTASGILIGYGLRKRPAHRF